jgi:hypothetical protein
MNGMTSPISQILMHEIRNDLQFVGIASRQNSVKAVGEFMEENDIVGTVYACLAPSPYTNSVVMT